MQSGYRLLTHGDKSMYRLSIVNERTQPKAKVKQVAAALNR